MNYAQNLNGCWACGNETSGGVCIGPHKEAQWRKHYKQNVVAAIEGLGPRKSEPKDVSRLPAPMELPRVIRVNLPAPIQGTRSLHSGNDTVLVYAHGSRIRIRPNNESTTH